MSLVVIEGLTQALRYAIPAGGLLAVVTIAGWALVARATSAYTLCDRLATAVVAATSVVVLASTWWAYRKAANAPIAWLLAALAVAGTAMLLAAALRGRREGAVGGSPASRWRAVLTRPRESVGLLGGALAVGLVQYWPVFRSGDLPGFVTAFSNPNNDLAIYILQSDNVLRRGFGEYGRVASFAVGSWTKGDHTGTSTFLAAAARLFGEPTWQLAIPFMIVVIAATALVLAAIVRRAGRIGWIGVGAAVLWASAAPFPSAVQSDYFLGQAMSRLLVLAQVLFVLQLLGRARVDRPALPLGLVALTTSAGFLAYPAGEVTALALVVVVGGALAVVGWFDRADGARGAMTRRFAGLVAAIAVGVLSVAPRWSMIVDTVRLYSNPDITGFPLPTARFRALVGIGRSSGAWSSWGVPVAIATLTLAVFGAVHVARRDRRRAVELLCLGGPAVAGYLVLVVTVGSSTYQTWKYLGTAQPLVIVAVAAFTVEGLRLLGRSVVGCVGRGSRVRLGWVPGAAVVGIAIFALATSQGTWRETVATSAGLSEHMVSASLVDAGRAPRVREQQNLQVALAPYFETMVAPVVLDVRGTRFGAPTYLGPASMDPGCTLTRLASHPELDGDRYHPLAGDLSIGPIARCEGAPQAPVDAMSSGAR